MSGPPAEHRLARILAVVPWVASADGPRISEVCERFGLTEPELMADLELLLYCGVHPFTPDTLIEVDIVDDRVWLRFADYFRRPLRLTPPEGLAVLAAGAALRAVPGAGAALASALAKLEDALGVSGDEALELQLGPAVPAVLDAVRRAAGERHKVRLDYYSYGRDGRSERVVHPWRVFNRAGQWYLRGWCERVDGERLFRVDRIRSVEVLADTFPPAPADLRAADGTRAAADGGGGAGTEVYQPGRSDPQVVLDLAPGAHWVAEQYPHEGVESRAGGIQRVRLRSSGPAWLERLLLVAGAAATVVVGDAELRARAAARILDRYRT